MQSQHADSVVRTSCRVSFAPTYHFAVMFDTCNITPMYTYMVFLFEAAGAVVDRQWHKGRLCVRSIVWDFRTHFHTHNTVSLTICHSRRRQHRRSGLRSTKPKTERKRQKKNSEYFNVCNYIQPNNITARVCVPIALESMCCVF